MVELPTRGPMLCVLLSADPHARATGPSPRRTLRKPTVDFLLAVGRYYVVHAFKPQNVQLPTRTRPSCATISVQKSSVRASWDIPWTALRKYDFGNKPGPRNARQTFGDLIRILNSFVRIGSLRTIARPPALENHVRDPTTVPPSFGFRFHVRQRLPSFAPRGY